MRILLPYSSIRSKDNPNACVEITDKRTGKIKKVKPTIVEREGKEYFCYNDESPSEDNINDLNVSEVIFVGKIKKKKVEISMTIEQFNEWLEKRGASS